MPENSLIKTKIFYKPAPGRRGGKCKRSSAEGWGRDARAPEVWERVRREMEMEMRGVRECVCERLGKRLGTRLVSWFGENFGGEIIVE